MASIKTTITWIFLIFCVDLIHCKDDTAKRGPPIVPGSFEAIGEILLGIDVETGMPEEEIDKSPNNIYGLQLVFEENFSAEKKVCSFKLRELGQETYFLEDLNAKQTFKYNDTGCHLYTAAEWQNEHVPPDIKILETKGDQLLFPLRQIFSLKDKAINAFIDGPTRVTFREIPVEKWTYKLVSDGKYLIREIDVEEYWSLPEWSTSSPDKQVPLGFKIIKTVRNESFSQVHNQFVTITHFVNNSVDEQALLVKEGIFCEDRKVSRIPFPNVKMLNFFTFSYEFVVPENRIAKNGRTWVDISQKLIRADYDPMIQPNPRAGEKYSISRIFSFGTGLTYEIGRTEDTECKVMANNEVDYDPQIIYDIQMASQWSEQGLFGIDRDIKYFYIGHTYKRGLPCNLWQGKRTDWPPSTPVTSVWEWCFADTNFTKVIFENNTYPLVALSIHIIDSKYDKSESTFYKGLKMDYHFYDIHTNANGTMLNDIFDILPCYSFENTYRLQFTVGSDNKKKDDVVDLSGAPFDAKFARLWMKAMYEQLSLTPDSLLIQDLSTNTDEKTKKTYVMFTLLDPLDSLPQGTEWKDRTKESMRKILLDATNAGILRIRWTPTNRTKEIELRAERGSLEFQQGFGEHISVITEPPLTTTTVKTQPPPKPKTTPESKTPNPRPHTPKPTTPESNTEPNDGKTTSTEPIDIRSPTPGPVTGGDSSSTEGNVVVTEKPRDKSKKEEDDPVTSSAIAGVVIGGLIAGIGLGAAGTFVKVKVYGKRSQHV